MQSNFAPEYGQSGDSIVSLTIKSGTNHFHGDVYELLRNRALDANSWNNNTAGEPKSLDHQSDFGGIVSGPVDLPKIYDGRDKTFFMFAYEGFRFNTGAERGLRSVALGRKNWMFYGSDNGGRTAAVLSSLIATCKRLGVDPFAYQRDLIGRIAAYPKSRIAELLPQQWRTARGATANF